MGSFSSDRTIREYARESLDCAQALTPRVGPGIARRCRSFAARPGAAPCAEAGMRSRRASADPGRGRAHVGALARDGGVNFAVFSDHAERIELCLFDGAGAQRTAALRRCTGRTTASSTASSPGVGAGPGLRPARAWPVRARPRAPLQPAQAAARPLGARDRRPASTGAPSTMATRSATPTARRSFDTRDNAAHALKARVAAAPRPAPGWLNAPRVPAPQTSCSTSCMSRASRSSIPACRAELRGTYAGLAHPAAIAHFKAPGRDHARRCCRCTTTSTSRRWPRRACVNYWGYNTLGFFCPDPRLPPATAAIRARWPTSSATWSPRCTSTASRSCSTWSTTTRPKATRPARR